MNPPTAAAVPTTYAEWEAAYGLSGAQQGLSTAFDMPSLMGHVTPGAPLRDIIAFLMRSVGERTPA